LKAATPQPFPAASAMIIAVGTTGIFLLADDVECQG
jgi:hypothetical protein